MPELVNLIVYLLVASGPFVGYFAMLRRGDRTRRQLIAAAMLGAVGPAFIVGAGLAMFGMPTVELLPWMLVALCYGAGVGVLGVVSRIVGAWLAHRQP